MRRDEGAHAPGHIVELMLVRAAIVAWTIGALWCTYQSWFPRAQQLVVGSTALLSA